MDETGTAVGAAPYGGPVRWEALFADLSAQLEAASVAQREADVADLTRAERATVALADRVRAASGARLAVTLLGGERLEGQVLDAAPTWVLLASGPGGAEAVVPLAAVAVVDGLRPAAAPRPGAVLSRLGLGHVLRAVARDRAVVRVLTTGGTVVGRVDSVGADHLDVALVHADSGRPTGTTRAVGFAALLAVVR